MGGGIALRNIAKGKIRNYIRYYHKCEPQALSREQKLPFIYMLHQEYGFIPREIAPFFGIAVSSVYREAKAAIFFHNHSRRQREEEKRIADYILYNAKWIPK